MSLRYLVPALAVAGRAAAATCSGTTTISDAAGASGLASCQTFSGSISIATGTTDDIALEGVREITGSLTARNVPKIASLSASSLQSIGDTFALDNVQILTTLSFPSLTMVDMIVWSGLPNLQGLSFTQSVSKASTLDIENTALNSLDGINLQVIDTLILANNPFLDSVSMQLGNVSKALSLEANGKDLQVDFPNLEWAYNCSFRNVSSLNIDSLASVNGSLGFYSNFFDSIAAPNLTTVGGSLSFVSNGALTNISMPELKTVSGGLQIANNTQLEKVDGFPRVSSVSGAVDMAGVFTTVDLPALTVVKGGFNLQSSGDLGNTCSHFQSEAGNNNVIRGRFTCKQTNNPKTTHTGSGSGSSSSSSGAANPVYISGATGVLGVMAAIFGML